MKRETVIRLLNLALGDGTADGERVAALEAMRRAGIKNTVALAKSLREESRPAPAPTYARGGVYTSREWNAGGPFAGGSFRESWAREQARRAREADGFAAWDRSVREAELRAKQAAQTARDAAEEQANAEWARAAAAEKARARAERVAAADRERAAAAARQREAAERFLDEIHKAGKAEEFFRWFGGANETTTTGS